MADQELTIRIAASAQKATAGLDAVTDALNRIEKALDRITGAMEGAMKSASTVSRAASKLASAINSLNVGNLAKAADEMGRAGRAGESASRKMREAGNAADEAGKKFAGAAESASRVGAAPNLESFKDAAAWLTQFSDGAAKASSGIREAGGAMASLSGAVGGARESLVAASSESNAAIERIGTSVLSLPGAFNVASTAAQAFTDYIDRAFRADMGDGIMKAFVDSIARIPATLESSMGAIEGSVGPAATVVDSFCREITGATETASDSIGRFGEVLTGAGHKAEVLEPLAAAVNDVDGSLRGAVNDAQAFVDAIASGSVTGLGEDMRWTSEMLQAVVERMAEYKKYISDTQRGKVAPEIGEFNEAIVGLERLTAAYKGYVNSVKEGAKGAGETGIAVISGEKAEEAYSFIQKLTSALEHYKQQVRGHEAGKIDLGEEKYDRALKKVAALEEALRRYKAFMGAMTGGDAGGESGGMDGMARSADEVSLRMQRVLTKIHEYESRIADMKALRVPFDDQSFRALTDKLETARQEWRAYEESTKGSGGELPGVSVPPGLIETIRAMSGELEKSTALMREVTGLFGGLSSVAETAFRASFKPLTGAVSMLKAAGGMVATFAEKISSLSNPIESVMARARKSWDKVMSSLKAGWAKIARTAKFMLIRKAITAILKIIGDAMKSLAQFEGITGQTFNKSMSTLISDVKYLGANIVAAFAPIINMVAPIIDFLVDKLVWAIEIINMFFAALSGKDIYVRARKRMEDFGKGAEDASAAQKELNKQLMSFDRLNNITTSQKANEGTSPWGDWEERPVDDKIKEFAEKVKKILKDLFEPLKKAWDIAGQYVIDGFKYMVSELAKLAKDIGRDFMEVWKQDATVAMFAEILMIVGDIEFIIGTLAERIREAWNHNKVGLHIFEDIRDIIALIVSHIHQATQDTLKWAKTLDFYPLLNKFEKALRQVLKALDPILQILNNIYRDIVLPMLKWALESGLPRLIQFVGNVVEGAGNLAAKFNEAWDSLEFGKAAFEGIRRILDVLMNHVENIGTRIREWGKEVDFEPLLKSVLALIDALEPVAAFIGGAFEDALNNVILPFFQYLIEVAFPALNDALRGFADAVHWDELRESLAGVMASVEGFLEAFTGGFIQAMDDVGQALAAFVNGDEFARFLENIQSFLARIDADMVANVLGGIGKAILGIGEAVVRFVNSDLFQGFLDAVLTYLESATADDIAGKIEGLAVAILGFKFAEFAAAGFANFLGFIAKLPMIVKGFGALGDVIAKLAPFLGKVSVGLAGIAGLWTAIKSFLDMMNEGFSGVKETIMLAGLAIAAVCASILGIVPLATAAIIAGIAGAVATAAVLIKEHWAEIDAFFSDALVKMQAWADGLDKSIEDAISGAVESIKAGIQAANAWIEDKVSAVVEWVKARKAAAESSGREFAEGLRQGIKEKLDSIQETASQWIDRLKQRFSSVNLASIGRNIINGFRQGISEAWKSFSDWLTERLKDLKEKFNIFEKLRNLFKGSGASSANAVQGFASGGYPERATLFWAGEGGVPEMVGTSGGRTAVASGGEITGIRSTIEGAAESELALLRQEVALLREIAAKEFGVSSRDVFDAVRSENRAYRMRTGRGAFAT